MQLKDSGEREVFASGASRDSGFKPIIEYTHLPFIQAVEVQYIDVVTRASNIDTVSDYLRYTLLRGRSIESFERAAVFVFMYAANQPFVRTSLSRTLPFDVLMRFAAHLTLGAEKYRDDGGADNWKRGAGDFAYVKRYRQSGLRHLHQWLAGEADEFHDAALLFNLRGLWYSAQLGTAEATRVIHDSVIEER